MTKARSKAQVRHCVSCGAVATHKRVIRSKRSAMTLKDTAYPLCAKHAKAEAAKHPDATIQATR